jgi:hypothetical protein
MIGVTPVPAQFDWAIIAGIGGFLAVLLAIAVVLQVVTAPRSDDEATPSGSSNQRLDSAV